MIHESALKTKRGLACVSPEKRKEIGAMGGRAVSRDKAHMSEIGKKGGTTASRDREWMRELGKKGGAANAALRGSEYFRELGYKGWKVREEKLKAGAP